MKRVLLTMLLFAVASTASAQIALRVSHAISSTSAQLYWSPYPGAASYTVSRTSHVPAYEALADTTALTATVEQPANTSYGYMVQARDASGNPIAGSNSNLALVSSFPFSDVNLATTTPIRAVHATELRTAIAAARNALGGLSTTWSGTIAAGTPIRATDITDLRSALVLTNAGGSSQGYDDPVLTGVAVRKRHIEQLRLRVSTFPEYVSASLSLTNPEFSPNGDGQKDTTTVSGTMAPNADPRWILNVRNSGGTLLRSATGAGSAVSYVWDGRNGSGVVQPEGVYTIELIDGDGTSIPVATATATIDLTAPAVAITAPSAGQVFSNLRQSNGAIAVSGTATDTRFAAWQVSILGPAPSTLASGTAAVPTATLLGTLQTLPSSGPLPNGTYTIRLTGTDRAGNTGTANVDVAVGHFTVSQNVNQINVAAGEHVTYTSIVPFALTETITIRSGSTVVRTLVNQQRAAGSYQDQWDTANAGGTLVADGTYTYTATADEGSGALTWTQAGQYLGNIITQYPYPQCRNASGAVVACDTVPFDPYTNQPMRIVYCNSGELGCVNTGPMFVFAKVSSGTETTPVCSDGTSYCIFSEVAQPGGQQEYAWYGMPMLTLADPPTRLTVIRRNDNFPRNMTVVYGTAPTISNLAMSSYMAGPGAPVTFTFNVGTYASRTATVSATFLKITNGGYLRTITSAAAPAGARSVVWDARADNGLWAAPGTYEVTLTVTDSAGSSATLKPIVTVRF